LFRYGIVMTVASTEALDPSCENGVSGATIGVEVLRGASLRLDSDPAGWPGTGGALLKGRLIDGSGCLC
jgi:hypothetical protein